MAPQINPDIKVADLVARYPETRSVFVAQGMETLVSEDGLRVLAPFLSLGTVLRSRGLAIEGFLRLLNEATAGAESLEADGLSDLSCQGELTLLALMPCGLKVAFSRAITAFLRELKAKQGRDVTCAVEGNLNQELSYYSYVRSVKTAADLPDIIVSSDFNSFYYHDFYRRFVETGDFVAPSLSETTATFRDAGIVDPLGQYHLFGVNPLVIVADLDQVGNRTLPQTWVDLQDPVWRRSLVLRGNADFFCHAVLLPLFREQGAEGLQRMGLNVMAGMHPAQMVKMIDSPGGGALYVMPEFFAHRVKKQDRIQIIWPEDGALASPVTLQVKRDRVEELQPILDYLTGPELGQVLVGARFPVPRIDVAGDLQQAPLKWLGWDYLRQHDIARVNAEIDALFMPAVRSVLS